jgi:hypothetical protein
MMSESAIAGNPVVDVPAAAPNTMVPGVYGIRIGGLDAFSLLAEVDADAPGLELSFEFGQVGDRTETFTEDRAEISLVEGGWMSLTRSGEAHLVLPRPTAAEEILHPWLVPAAATFNGWQGRQVLHGGAFCRDGRAVAILGAKEDGKSSMLAWLSGMPEVEILADDLVIVDEGTVFAGPRCIDLRPGSLQAVRESCAHRLVRDATRMRLGLGPCSPTAALEGIVILAWNEGPEVTIEALSPSEGVIALFPHALNAGRRGFLLDLLEMPIWVLRRPKSWSAMPAVADRLLGLLD